VTIFDFSPPSAAWHLLYLLSFLALGSSIALRLLTKRLIT
jgi:hypothetical protein